jgi:AraC-like DNA-binding protein
MSQQQAILRAITYMDAHLRDSISVADVAAAAGYSLYHFCRVFGTRARQTPYDYLIRRRMTEAAEAVLHSDQRIIDIALDYQFDSHEGFTRAFGRMYGCAPSEARQQGDVPALCRLPRLTAAHLDQLAAHDGLTPTLETCTAIPPAWTRLPVVARWPARPTDRTQFTAADLPGPFARFDLSIAPDDLPLILDWVLHVWLFYTDHTLRLPVLLLAGDAPDLRLVVPVARVVHAG